MIASIAIEDSILYLQGDWTLSGIAAIDLEPYLRHCRAQRTIVLDFSSVEAMDTAGAWLCHQLQSKLKSQSIAVSIRDIPKQAVALLNLIAERMPDNQSRVLSREIQDPLALIGMSTVNCVKQFLGFLTFIGEVVTLAGDMVAYRGRLRLKAIISTVYRTGYTALPIIGLLSFLIGVVLAYQMGVQLSKYGANIYIVNLLGLSVLREFGPLMTAIIVAGRTSSAFTSEISTMKINEEIDALRTLGITPTDILVIPKILGVLIAMPLLCVWSDIFGILGGMIMSHFYLGITPKEFLEFFQQNIAVRHFIIGVSKTPAFAIIISAVGCYQGFCVKGGAESVGWQTTVSVVQAIFMIIIADAAFSVIYSWMQL